MLCRDGPEYYIGPITCASVHKGFNASLRMKDKNIMDIDLRSGEGSGADCFHGVQNGVRWYALPPAVFPKLVAAAVVDQGVVAILQQPSVMLDFLFLLFCSVLFCSVLFCSVLLLSCPFLALPCLSLPFLSFPFLVLFLLFCPSLLLWFISFASTVS